MDHSAGNDDATTAHSAAGNDGTGDDGHTCDASRVLVKIWTSDAMDEKPARIALSCDSADDDLFGAVQARVARRYAAERPHAPPLRFWPNGTYVATNAARGPVFYAEQKMSDVLAQIALDRGNEIHVLDIHRLAAAHGEPVSVPLLPASSSSSSRTDASRPRGTPPVPRRPPSSSSPSRTTIRCTADGCWVSAKDIVCDALSLWGVHSALPQNTVRRMKEHHPSMFVKRALSGGGAHAPVIDANSIDLFCERCAAVVAPAHVSAMRAYPTSDRRTRSMAHVLARRTQHATAATNTNADSASPSAPLAPAAACRPYPSSAMPSTTPNGSSASACASPSSVSNDSDSLLPEDGWSTDDEGAAPVVQRAAPPCPMSDQQRRRSTAHHATADDRHEARHQECNRAAYIRRSLSVDGKRRRYAGAHPADDEPSPGAHRNGPENAPRVRDTDDRPQKRRRTSRDGATHADVDNHALAADLIDRCTAKDQALAVWKWNRHDRCWRMSVEVRRASDTVGSLWEVTYDAQAPSGDTAPRAWMDANGVDALVRDGIASPRALVVVGHRHQQPLAIDALYDADGVCRQRGSEENRGQGGDRRGNAMVASILDGGLASECRVWTRAPDDRRKGLALFRRAVALNAVVADGPYASRWQRLVDNIEKALL